ncbi:MAG: 30S ribosomal protein S17e [Candidatus Woesearchaeota archaeon]
MGRIKTKLTKRVTNKLVNEHREKFSGSFDKNKEVVGSLADIQSKKLRNIIAGYVTRLVKTK